MFKLNGFLVIVCMLIACEVVAQDVFIAGGDNVALQAAIDAANTADSQVTIHLEAGQVFEDNPQFGQFTGNLKIEGNGAIFGRSDVVRSDPLGSIATSGVVAIIGVTCINTGTGPVRCSLIHDQGSVSL